MRNRYSINIQTNYDGIALLSCNTKKQALKEASYYRTGGLSYRNTFSENDSPKVEVFDAKTEKQIYCQPLFKNALKN
jgi:hypothetical protein